MRIINLGMFFFKIQKSAKNNKKGEELWIVMQKSKTGAVPNYV